VRERERESRHLMMEGTKMDRESLSSFVRSFTVIWSKEDQDKINRSKRGGELVVIFLPLSCFQLPSCQLPSSYSLIPFPLPHQTFKLILASPNDPIPIPIFILLFFLRLSFNLNPLNRSSPEKRSCLSPIETSLSSTMETFPSDFRSFRLGKIHSNGPRKQIFRHRSWR